ncbi:hypothetical protein Sjap_006568 [Stephania japonica]|uniref:Reverse transcriptase domain-containing protein n=1 Tax=Stephania japonica TaxID=461633 RepID=A0AAP0PM31_9MAGN
MQVFTDCWGVFRQNIMAALNDYHRTRVIDASMIETLVCLIPKNSKACKVSHFCPISLVSSLYKTISKVLVRRLRHVVGSTVALEQGAFMEGHQLTYLVLIASESVEEYRHKKKAGFVLKLDLAKAYDHVDWLFLDYVLMKKGIGAIWRKWIYGCISSVSFSVLINGKPQPRFATTRGMCQGCSLSPFLFIIVANVFSRMMKMFIYLPPPFH